MKVYAFLTSSCPFPFFACISRSKIATNIEKKEKKTTETAKKVQEMQASLQAAAADAARAIAAQNS